MPNRWLPAALAVALCLTAAPIAAQAPDDAATPAGKVTDAELKAEALKLNSLTSEDAGKARLTEIYKDKERSKRLLAIASKMLKAADEGKSPFKYNAGLTLGKLGILLRDWATAEQFFQSTFANAKTLQSSKKLIESYKFLVAIYNEQKQFDKAEELTKRMLDTGENSAEDQLILMESLIRTLAKGGNTEEAIAKIDGLITFVNQDAARWYFVKLKGDVYLEADQLDKAIEKYLETVERLKEVKKMPKDQVQLESENIRYMLTGVYVDNKQPDMCIKLLEELIEESPERSTYYNDLGYVMADNGKDLKEAEKYVRKALKLDADLREKLLEEGKIDKELAIEKNSAYLDSLGWVLFKQGKYKEAYEYLEKASRDPDEGNHIEIWDHVADCLVKLGKTDEAIEVWTKALKLEDVSKRDTERRKKVEAKLKAATAEAGK